MNPVDLAILASGAGSNANALMQALGTPILPRSLARIVGVISDVPEAPVLEIARRQGVPAFAIPRQGQTRQEHEAQLVEKLRELNTRVVLLAGYMRLLSAQFLACFSGNVLNIHPSLLPDFPGLRAVERQFEAGLKTVGATVHMVDAGVDSGPVLLQGSTPVRPGDTVASLTKRLQHEVEHAIYPRAVRTFLDHLQRSPS